MESRAKIIGGGTGIYELAGRGLLSDTEALVDVSGLGWSYVKKDSESLRIGSATTMAQLMQSKELGTRSLGALVDALGAIQPIQVKNVATIGGAICMGLPFFDLPTALVALGSLVHVGPSGRVVGLADFIRGYFELDLSPQEFVTEVEIPTGEEKRSSAFQKFALTRDDWAIVNCGVSLLLDRGGKIRDPRMVFGGGVGSKPVWATKAERALDGSSAKESEVRSVLEKELPLELETVADFRSSAEYRLELAKVLGRRTVLAACERVR